MPLPDDVPSRVDFRVERDAREWAETAMRKRPYRTDIFAAISRELAARGARRVLELGSGPGFLAERILADHPAVEYTALDFSPAMHAMARERLGPAASRVRWVERSFASAGWPDDLGRVDAAVTVQAVHELRHKRHAPALYRAVHGLLERGGLFLVCDHHSGTGGMEDGELFMTPEEQHAALQQAGFARPVLLLRIDPLVLFRCVR